MTLLIKNFMSLQHSVMILRLINLYLNFGNEELLSTFRTNVLTFVIIIITFYLLCPLASSQSLFIWVTFSEFRTQPFSLQV